MSSNVTPAGFRGLWLVTRNKITGGPPVHSSIWRKAFCKGGRIKLKGSSWNRVGNFWVESARKAGIARAFCISRDAIFGMNSGWHDHRNAASGYGILILSQVF